MKIKPRNWLPRFNVMLVMSAYYNIAPVLETIPVLSYVAAIGLR